MKVATSMHDCEEVLADFASTFRHTDGKEITTEKAQSLALFVGSPEKTLKIVHVAGTSGKTSTSYYSAALLQASGEKVGLSVSPHINSVAERALINGVVLPDETYIDYFNEFHALVIDSSIRVSYFEFLMVFALWVFAREHVEYAVIETGLGGLYDASNICTQPNKVCVITDVGLDHVHVLGNTIYEIASQKAGIAWKHNMIISYHQSHDVSKAIRERAEIVDAKIYVIAPIDGAIDSTIPVFQQRNWNLAYETYKLIATRDSLPSLSNALLEKSRSVIVPARMQQFEVAGKMVIVDGAHNQQKMQVFFESYETMFPGIRPLIVMSLKHSKDGASIAPFIAKYADSVIATEFTKEQDMQWGAQSVHEIEHELRTAGIHRISLEKEVTAALDMALEADSKNVLVIGSFFLAAEVIELLRNTQPSHA